MDFECGSYLDGKVFVCRINLINRLCWEFCFFFLEVLLVYFKVVCIGYKFIISFRKRICFDEYWGNKVFFSMNFRIVVLLFLNFRIFLYY